jgi:leucyl-tRNA synthetase
VHCDERGRPGATLRADGQPVIIGGTEKMSKSKNNGVDPQALIDQYGADTARLFIMFASPPDQSLEWSDAGVEGAFRFLKRVWRIVFEHVSAGPRPAYRGGEVVELPELKAFRRQLHQTIGKVTDDYGRASSSTPRSPPSWSCSTPYAKLRDDSATARAVKQETLEAAALMLYPIVPHVCEALYAALRPGLHGRRSLPEGRRRGGAGAGRDRADAAGQRQAARQHLRVPAGADKASIEAAALACGSGTGIWPGRAEESRRRPGRLVNIVV